MKKLLLIILLSVLLVSCQTKPSDITEQPPADDPNVTVDPVVPEEETELPDESQPQFTEFEYKITARDYESIYTNLSNEQMTREFLSAVCLKDLEVLQVYMLGDTTEELMKIKADVMIDGGKTVTEYFNGIPFEGLETKVKFIVSQSDSKHFPIGVYDYVLYVRKSGAFGIEYFGPEERYPAFQNAVVPVESTSPVLYNAYKFVEEFYRNIKLALSKEALDPNVNFDAIMHTAVHTRMALGEDYIFTTTLEEFKEYVSLQFGYTDEAVLNRFATALSKAAYASVDENGVYTVCCAHGHGSLSYDLTSIEMVDGKYVFTYAVYSDTAHTVQCKEDIFTFEENKDSDMMTLVDIRSTVINDLEEYVFSI